MDSHQVPTMFSMCSSRVFPGAIHFNPICFAQSPSLLSYIGGPKGETPSISVESSISRASINAIFCFAMGQLTCSWSFCHLIMPLDQGVSKIWVPLAPLGAGHYLGLLWSLGTPLLVRSFLLLKGAGARTLICSRRDTHAPLKKPIRLFLEYPEDSLQSVKNM
jgi:hypothetical protein